MEPRIYPILFLCLYILMVVSCKSIPETFDPVIQMYKINQQTEHLFDEGWRFKKTGETGMERSDFPDEGWRVVDLPHDWSIEDLDNPLNDDNIIGPFSKASAGGPATGHVLGGIGWYRKHFKLSEKDKNKMIYIHFDGAYMNTDVWINGHHLGNHPYGYTAFSYNLTPYINYEGENVLAVEVKNEGKNSRWYSGSGIYRHVWLKIKNSSHMKEWGLSVLTDHVSESAANLMVGIEINQVLNSTKGSVEFNIYRPDGGLVKTMEKDLDTMEFLSEMVLLNNPRLWSFEEPNLYVFVANLKDNGKVLDRQATAFGIRSLEFSAESGFVLNGKPTLLKGGCVHHDNGALGAATFDRAEYRKIETLKANGFNAIRTSHNPPSRQLLDACDKLGMLVIDEAFDQWQKPKNPDDYHRYFDASWEADIKSMLRRDKNHPSIIMWSIGNEIRERTDSSGIESAKKLIKVIKEIDPSRPTNAGICGFWDNPGKTWDESALAFQYLDVAGYNYKWREYESDHLKHPERIIVGTESVAREALQNWDLVEKNPYIIGDFVWTAYDYFGESGIGHSGLDNEEPTVIKSWPWHNGYCGDLDVCGVKKPQSYYRDVVWGQSKLEMAVHRPLPEGVNETITFWGWPDEERSWTWPGHEGDSIEINVYTTFPEISLAHNGEKFGHHVMLETDSIIARFKTVFSPGRLAVYGLENGIKLDSVVFETAGEPAQLKVISERQIVTSDKNDLIYFNVEVLDNSGRRIPQAEIPLHFTVEGAGNLIAVASGNPARMASFQKAQCTTFRGRCQVIVRPTGKSGDVSLQVYGEGLTPELASVKIDGH